MPEPIDAVAFSDILTCATDAANPAIPTDAPITVEFTAATEIGLPTGRVIVLFSPELIIASTRSEDALSMTASVPI